jgi:menaquinone-dependent protoporphyrinogen oxidase
MKRVLVTYASKHGSTAEIARAIAEELKNNPGLDSDCVNVEVASLSVFDAVILGSAVYDGHWRREAQHFLKQHHDQLSKVPLWIFSSGPVGEHLEEEVHKHPDWLEPHHVLDLAESAGMRGHVVFGGKLPANPVGHAEKKLVEDTPAESRDARDWDAIREWADDVARQLTSAPA